MIYGSYNCTLQLTKVQTLQSIDGEYGLKNLQFTIELRSFSVVCQEDNLLHDQKKAFLQLLPPNSINSLIINQVLQS